MHQLTPARYDTHVDEFFYILTNNSLSNRVINLHEVHKLGRCSIK